MNTLWLIALLAPAAEAPRTAISSSVVLKVADRNRTADQLIAEAEKVGGYFSSRSDDHVTLKIPTEHAKAFLAKLEPLGKIVQRAYKAEDVGERLQEMRTLLRSRQQVFDRYFAVLASAGPNTVVEVEGAMTFLVQEMETLKGTIRLLEHQVALAELTVRFEFRDRQPPERSGSSSFAWLNTMNLVDVMEDFAHAH